MKKQLSQYIQDQLSLAFEHILCVGSFCKGFIVADDETGEMLNLVKDQLYFERLVDEERVNEISIDKSWDLADSDNAFQKCWKRLIVAADEAKNGLLVIHVSDIRLFNSRYIWCVRQLAKQESDDIYFFHGYVLLVLEGFSWEDVKGYATKFGDRQFDATLQFYRVVKFED